MIYRCVVGSRAYGLDDEGSDTDRRGIYLPPAELHWSLYGVPEQLENDDTQESYWELQKFLMLALKANPNVLECLYTPLVEHATPLAEELLAMRAAFLSQLVYQTYNGYVLSQFKKLEQDLRNQRRRCDGSTPCTSSGCCSPASPCCARARPRPRRTSTASGCSRSGAAKCRGTRSNAWRLALHREFDAAYAATRLPERPDYERVNAFLHPRPTRERRTGET